MSMPPELPRIGDYLDHWAQAAPEREALVLGKIRWTYRALTLGLNPKFPLRELQYFVDDAKPCLLLGFAEDAEGDHCETLDSLVRESASLERVVTLGDGALSWDDFLAEGADVGEAAHVEARRAVRPRDPALLVYTAGSTGRPKGAVLPNCGLAFCSRVQADRWAADPVRLLVNLPVNHIGFMGDMCCYALVAGGTAFFMERFDPVGILELIANERITGWGQVPTMFQITVAQPQYQKADLSSLQTIIWGGARASKALLETLAQTGARLATSYGMTETTGSVTYTGAHADADELANTVGTPDPRYEVRIAHPDGTPVKAGEEGEIQVRGDHIMIDVIREPGGDPSEAELRDFCKQHLVNFKVPKTIIIRDMLPILPIGKVDKVTLQKEARAESEPSIAS